VSYRSTITVAGRTIQPVARGRDIVAAGDLELHQTVYTTNGRDRLKLLFVRAEEFGSDFHSLVWERRIGQESVPHHTLTQDDFEWQHDYWRWVSDIHSISPEDGTAVLMLGESDRPKHPPRGYSVIYSWRVWDLLNNREVKKVRECEPFDKYDEG